MEWFKSIPKVELHAHLNGSIRDSTLLELARDLGEKGIINFPEVEHAIQTNDRSVNEVFKLFDVIHIVTTDHSTLTRVTREVVEDFASENVVYLELRTTPKRNDAIGMSKRSYMEAVIQGLSSITAVDVNFCPRRMQAANNPTHDSCDGPTRKKIFVRLLLSIDRRENTASAMETVQLALDMQDKGVIGIDLSGNPAVGQWETFLPALDFARGKDLRITLHCGEIPNRKEEVQAMLDFRPGRIGHACWLDDEDWKRMKLLNVPVEICLTSNIRTGSIPSIEVHHFADLYREKHPIVLCTDDFGIFSTSLSGEYNIAASSFGITKKELFQLANDAIGFIFADDEVKNELEKIFDSAARHLDL